MRSGKKVTGLIVATILLLTFAGAALALTTNLFTRFGSRDKRYEKVADRAELPTSSPVTVEEGASSEVNARFDSALYDGMTLNAALFIERYCRVEESVPDEESLLSMETLPELPLFDMENGDKALNAAKRALTSAVNAGTPYGYTSVQCLPSDHVWTDDGIEIPPYSGDSSVDETGRYVEIREFDSPLPQALQNLDALTLNCEIYCYEETWYFDGATLYHRHAREFVGTIRATVPRSEGMVQEMRGAFDAKGASCAVSAQVSAMSAVVTFDGGEGLTLRALLGDPIKMPEGVDPLDVWVDMTAYDEKGRAYLSTYGLDADQPFPITQVFKGVGELPKWLELDVYWAWEGDSQNSSVPPFSIRLDTIE